MSSWLEYDDMSLAQWSGLAHRKRVKKMAKLYEASQEAMRLARSLESQERLQAILAYQESRLKNQVVKNRDDIALYYVEKKTSCLNGGRV